MNHLRILKLKTEHNASDVLTKSVKAKVLVGHLRKMGYVGVKRGRFHKKLK